MPIYRVELDDKAVTLVTPVVRAAEASVQSRWSMVFAVAVVLLAVIGGAIWWYSQNSKIGPVATVPKLRIIKPEDRHAIAILPFVNFSGTNSRNISADGMTEDLITDLSKIRSLSVISRDLDGRLQGQED